MNKRPEAEEMLATISQLHDELTNACITHEALAWICNQLEQGFYEGGQALQNEYRLRREAEQRAEEAEAATDKLERAYWKMYSQLYNQLHVVNLDRAKWHKIARHTEALAALVTPDLPDLLVQLAQYANFYSAPHAAYDARALAAKIRKALEANDEN